MQGKSEAAMREHGGGNGNDAADNQRLAYSTASESRKQEPAHGRLSGDVWSKSARASVHMLRAPKAWALDVADLDAAERCGVKLVHVSDLEQLRHYWATLATVRRRGFAFNRRHGEQVALTLEHWKTTRGEAEAVSVPEPQPEPEPEPVAVQERLPW